MSDKSDKLYSVPRAAAPGAARETAGLPQEPLEHKINLRLAGGAELTLLYFSDREQRWIFSYDYFGEWDLSEMPDLVNKVRLTAEYANGRLANEFVLSMHIVIPARLGQQFFAGVDISPGAKTYLEFRYRRHTNAALQMVDYRLVEICKGGRDRVSLDANEPRLVRQLEFPFPIPDRLVVSDHVCVPFRLDSGEISHFELPTRTLR